MYAMCRSSGTRLASGSTKTKTPLLAKAYPTKPEIADALAMQANRIAMARTRERAVRRGPRPRVDATAKGTPNRKPTHQVAMTPQTSPNRVGDSVATILGWPIVKYSTQMRAVTWS